MDATNDRLSPAKRKNMAKVLTIVFGLAGVVLTIIGAVIVMKAKASANWPSTEGKIVISEVKEEVQTIKHSPSRTGSDRSRLRTRTATNIMYVPHVVYEYAVDETKYTSNRVKFGQLSSSDYNDAAAVVARYPIGDIVAVQYDPAEPTEAVLEAGAGGSSFFVLIFGIAGLVASAVLFVVTRKMA